MIFIVSAMCFGVLFSRTTESETAAIGDLEERRHPSQFQLLKLITFAKRAPLLDSINSNLISCDAINHIEHRLAS